MLQRPGRLPQTTDLWSFAGIPRLCRMKKLNQNWKKILFDVGAMFGEPGWGADRLVFFLDQLLSSAAHCSTVRNKINHLIVIVFDLNFVDCGFACRFLITKLVSLIFGRPFLSFQLI